MRSPEEIRFRLKQELSNVRLWLSPPSWAEPLKGPLPGLRNPEEVIAEIEASPFRTEYCGQIESLAEELLQHRFRLLGLPLCEFEYPIRWRRDFVNGKETDAQYFRCVPYLDFERAGDHKVIWELNRHQHLVLLAQAFLLTGREKFLDEIPRQLDHWMQENPAQMGINWASALEVAFRAHSWLWVLHLVGEHFDEGFRRRWINALYHHGLHLEFNLSFYFSPNTHLLGEAVVLSMMGQLLPDMPAAKRWNELGTATVLEQMRKQVRDDGSHFEQSTYYHLYATDFFLLHNLVHRDTPTWYREKLAKMAEFLDSIVSSDGILPLIGDEDGGRLFHPYGDRRRFAEATLASCARWFGKPQWRRHKEPELEQTIWWMEGSTNESTGISGLASRWFADAGIVVLRAGDAQIIVDAGPFGSGSAGHSHADTLSLVAFRNGKELLIDPGTYTYISDPAERQNFRGTAAHNTVAIDHLDQGEPQGPFRWTQPPAVKVLHWSSVTDTDLLVGECQYRGFTHRRSLAFLKPGILVVCDLIEGSGRHGAQQRWLAPEGPEVGFLATFPQAKIEEAERSCALQSRQPARRWVAGYEGNLPIHLVAVIRLDGARAIIHEVVTDAGATVKFDGGTVHFPPSGAPQIL